MLELKKVSCRYDKVPVIEDCSLWLEKGSIGALLGPSGCGKTTLLKLISGFQQLEAGSIRLRGQIVARPGRQLPPEKRRIGLVFQDFALFPHLDVERNILFGIRHLPQREQAQILEELYELTGLGSLQRAFPHELSGGQQQRVALARALAPRPDLVLLDEPFSSLDTELRCQLASDVAKILRTTGSTALLVTHDQDEAFTMADHVGVLKEGRLLQWDSPFQLYHHPANRCVAEFIGRGVFVPAKVLEKGVVHTALGTFHSEQALAQDPQVASEMLVRPDQLLPDPQGELAGIVIENRFSGATTRSRLRLANDTIVEIESNSRYTQPEGATLKFRVELSDVLLFPARTSDSVEDGA